MFRQAASSCMVRALIFMGLDLGHHVFTSHRSVSFAWGQPDHQLRSAVLCICPDESAAGPASRVDESAILAAITGCLILQGLMMPIVGSWVDKYGALVVMTRGFLIGAVGLLLMPMVASLIWFWGCMVLIGIAHAMSSYETAFGAAVQMDEDRSRRNISFITFYGGVASSITWLLLAPLLDILGLQGALAVAAAVLLAIASRLHHLARTMPHRGGGAQKPAAPFSWRMLTGDQKRALLTLATSNTLEYVVFSATTLLWITWFGVGSGRQWLLYWLRFTGLFRLWGAFWK